jgi:oxygen-dependent protoporphyrinogen oxidase
VAVIGGGISGLAAAWELREVADVTVFEPGRLGGRILTTPFAGRLVDEGPDAFITRAPEALLLCEEVGISEDLISPAAGRALLWMGGQLRPIPEGLVLGVPRRLSGVLRSRILSPAGVARAACDLVLPRGRPPATLTVRELVASRFGAQVADRLVDPLVGGIHAGSTASLAAAEVTPMLVAAAERSRSLLLGLRSGPAPDRGPQFAAPRGGLGQLVDALVAKLREKGVRFVAEPVEAVRAERGPGVTVLPDPESYDGAVVATPAAVAADLLGVPGAADLARVRTASVALVTVAFDEVVAPPGWSGFLVPRGEGRLLTACSFGSNKWPHWAGQGQSVVRLSAGRDVDPAGTATRPSPAPAPALLDLTDDELTGRLVEELGEALGRPLAPTAVRVSRWPDAFPQYHVGHGRRVAQVETAVRAALPTVALAGAAYQGSGLPACIASGRRAARAVLEAACGPAGSSTGATSATTAGRQRRDQP